MSHLFLRLFSKVCHPTKLTLVLSVVTGLCFLTFTAIFWRLTVYFNQSPYDGVFQTLFPLREMNAGRLPGRDFYYFHGNGIPYLLYPLYKLSFILKGTELKASLIAAFLVNTAFLYVPIFVLIRKMHGTAWAFGGVLALSMFMEVFLAFGFYHSVSFIGAPMGIRFAPPLLIAVGILYYLQWRENCQDPNWLKISWRLLLVGGIGGLGPFLGAEQGFYALAGTLGSVILLGLGKQKILARLATAALLIIGFTIGFLAPQLLLQSFNSSEALSLISKDQMWVYGVFPNSFFSDWHQIFTLSIAGALTSQLSTLCGTFALAMAFLAARLHLLTQKHIFVLSLLYFSGLLSWLSNIGYVGQHQASMFFRMGFLTFFMMLPAAIYHLTNKAQSKIAQRQSIPAQKGI